MLAWKLDSKLTLNEDFSFPSDNKTGAETEIKIKFLLIAARYFLLTCLEFIPSYQ